MPTRRQVLTAAAAAAASAVAFNPFTTRALEAADPPRTKRYRIPHRLGLGGVAIGTGFAPLTGEQSDEVMHAAWAAGNRYFDTSPWYGLGLSERRMGHVLADQPREEFVISTKVGRLLSAAPSPQDRPKVMWKAPSPFSFKYDYTADGTKRSIEDSLQRLGLAQIDVVFIHDLSPDHFGQEWTEQFDVAAKGAIPALTKMRDEGVIKGWGFGVNDVEPCLRALEVGEPDVFLLATQYSLVRHDAPLTELFPKCEQRGVSIVVGAPFNSGLLAGKERYNYRNKVPPEIRQKANRIAAMAKEHGTDLRTASLQFCAAPKVVCSVIPGASSGKQVEENTKSMSAKIPSEFWAALKREKLIAGNAPTPA
jgi:D-threo-aldose 1-dehydrogenase